MKDYIWVVEVNFGDGWQAMDFGMSRELARSEATRRRANGYLVRIRKYVRAQS